MFARIATFEGGDPDEIRRINNDMLVAGSELPEGICRVLVLEGDTRRHVITFFETREALAASEARFEAMGDEIPESVRGRRVSLEVSEVVLELEAVR